VSPAGEYHFEGNCWCGLDHSENRQWTTARISKSEVVGLTRRQVVNEIRDAIRRRDATMQVTRDELLEILDEVAW
jgi:hypothetical protein